MGLKSWLFTVSIFISLTIPSYLFCQTTNISGIINTYTKVTNIITVVANCTTTSTITVVSPIGFNVGDKVMIAQMKGAIIDTTNTIGFGTITTYNNAGNFEFATIDSINGNDIVLKDPLGYTYTSSGFVQLVTVPQYNNAIVNATLTASPWNGNTGGILVFEASDSVTLDADINVDGLGFRGGVPSITTINCRTDYFYTLASGGGGQKGEGITDRKIAYEAGRGALANGGGGGNDHNSGGAGGGNYGSGGTGGNAIYHAGYNCLPNYMVGGKGGKALDYDSCRIFLGGGGGGGHWYNSVNGIKGMDGGGMIIISANEIIGNGYTISAEGMDQTISASIDGAGGGGAGGTIFITNQTYTDTLIITVNGGDGGDVSNNNKSYCHGAGGGGGGGIVWISSSSIPGNIITEVNGGTMGINTNSNAYFPCKGLPFGASDGQIGTVLTSLVFSTCSSPTTQNKEADLDTTICAGQSIQFSYDTSLVYDWTPGTYLNDSTIADPISNPSDSIVYQVITSDSCMNLDTFLISLNVKQLPVINLTTDTVICTYDSILLSASGGGTYLWSPSANLSCTSCPNPQAKPPITSTYTVVVTDTINFVSIDSVTIQVAPFVTAAAGPDTVICFGDSATLHGSGGNIYKWSPSTGLSDTTIANPKASPIVSTTYILEVTDSLGCSEFDTVQILVYPVTTINAKPDTTICSVNAVQLQSTGGISYSWTPTTGLSCTSCPNPIATPLVTTTYYVTVTDSNNCSRTDSVTVIVDPPIVSVAWADTTICIGDSITLNASGGNKYDWSPSVSLNDPNLPSPTATPATSTNYVVVIFDTTTVCPPDTLSIIVIVDLQTMGAAFADTTICAGESVVIHATGGQTYLWSPASTIDNAKLPSPTATPIITTSYVVIITDTSTVCPPAKETVIVTVAQSPPVDAGISVTIIAGSSTTLNASGTGIFTWTPTTGLSCNICQSPIATPAQTTTYTVMITDSQGCKSSDTVTVYIIEDANCRDDMLFVPNAFTPNNDKNNDKLLVFADKNMVLIRFMIYDRWGNQVFYTNDITQGWDGTFNGKPMDAAVFAYHLEIRCANDEIRYRQGDITLIR